MTLAQHKVQLAQKVLQTDDKNILKTIEIIFNQQNETFELNDADKQEINRRLAAVESGKSKLYTFNEVKKIIRKNFKKTAK